MRILFLGGYGIGRSLEDLWDGFQMVGADCAYLPYMGTLENPELLKEVLDTGDFTAIIGFCMYHGNERTIEVLKQSSAYKLMWQFDSPHREMDSPDLLAKQLIGWDTSLCSADGEYVQRFFKSIGKPFHGIFPPPVIANLNLTDQAIWDNASQYLLTVIGQPHTAFHRVVCSRGEVVDQVRKAYGEESVGVFGRFWEPDCPVLDWHECLYYWAGAKFALGHHGEKDDHWYLNGRDTRAMGAGACYIVDRANQLDTMLEDGKHCFFYDNANDVVDIIRDLKDDEETCNAVRLAGQKFITDNYRQDVMAMNIIKIIEDATGETFAPMDANTTKPVVTYTYMPIDTEGEGPPELSKLWDDTQAGTRGTSGFHPFSYEVSIPDDVISGKAGLRVMAYSKLDKLIGQVALVNRNLGGINIGGICGMAVDSDWWNTGMPSRLLEVVKEVGRTAGYRALVAYIGKEQRTFFRQCGYNVHPGRNIAIYTYDRNIGQELLWDAAHDNQDRW